MAILEKLDWSGRVVSCYASPLRETGLQKHRLPSLDLTFDGITGDCHASRIRASDSRMLKQYKRGTPVKNNRQVSLVSVEELADIAAVLGILSLDPCWLGANLVTQDIPDLTLLPPSTRLMFSSGATLIVDLENAPCRFPAEIIEQHYPGQGLDFPKKAKHKRGVVAYVEKEGRIAEGDEIFLFIPPQRIYAHGRKA
jgi:MOSC domain-containing protein YiiM